MSVSNILEYLDANQALPAGSVTASMLASSAAFTATVTASKTSAYSAAAGDFVQCDPSSGGFTVTLPAVAVANRGQAIIVKNTTSSANTITIAKSGSDTIDGSATSATIAKAYGTKMFVSDGTSNWDIVPVPVMGEIVATAGSEASHAIEVACSLTDYAGRAMGTTQVLVRTLAVTADKGDLTAAGTPVGTLKKAVNPSTGENVAWMETTSGGLFSFTVTDSAAEDCLVHITADGCRPRTLKLTFAG